MADIPAAIRRVGEITRHGDEAQQLAQNIENELTRLTKDAKIQTRNYRTLLLFDSNTPVTCGPETFVSELTALAGGSNIATSLTEEYDSISLEWIVAQDPELIICLFKTAAPPEELFENRAGWKEVKAVREARVIAPANLDIICRPGPRVLEGIRELRDCIEKCEE
jgi:iron complex transport system substrate-binding protein